MQAKDQFEDLITNKAMMSAGEIAYTKFKIDDYMPEAKEPEALKQVKKTVRKVLVDDGSQV